MAVRREGNSRVDMQIDAAGDEGHRKDGDTVYGDHGFEESPCRGVVWEAVLVASSACDSDGVTGSE